jgi:L-ascorbate metabolism protein UlaG (beta-lactamase superfamily)/rhodanese-related sulfurtransferase
LLLDVRTASEFAESHIADAVNIDVNGNDFIKKALERLDKQFTIAVYCRSGRRSANAANQLAKEGFKVVNLTGGINAWTDAQMPVSTQKLEWDAFATKNGKTLKIYSLIHASLRFIYADKEIQIDPVGKMGDRITDYAQMPKANWIVVTHEHGDHLDKAAIETLSDANTRIITNQRCVDILGKGIMMKNGDKRDESLGDEQFTLEAVPAYNITEGRQQFHPKGRDNGFILTLDGLRIYIAADTEDIPEMANIKDIDIAFLPCNQPYTMTVEQLVNAARMVKPTVLFPYHYGQTDVSGIPSQLEADGIEVRIRRYE